MNAFDDFPVRPQYIEGESLAGYVYRVHDANGHLVPRALNKAVRSLYRGWAATEAARTDGVKRLQRMLGQVSSLHEAYWLDDQQKIQLPASWPRWAGVQGDQFAVCPQCLKEFGTHLAIWELPLVSACPLHRGQLTKICPSCGSNIAWTGLLCDWKCRCGQSLIDIEVQPAPVLDCDFSLAIANSIDVMVPSVLLENAKAKHYLDRIEALPIELFYKRLYKLRDLRRLIVDNIQPGKAGYSYPGPRARTQPSRWEWSLMINWPQGFQESLARAARRLFRANTQTFVMLDRESLVSRFIYATSLLQEADVQVEPIYQATLDLLERFKAPVHERLHVFFNPGLTLAQRSDQLAVACAWWRSNRSSEQLKKTDGQASNERKVAYPGSEAKRTEAVVTLLNELMSCALEGVETEQSRAWLQKWPDVRRGDLNDDAFILDLSTRLVEQPVWWLESLLEKTPVVVRGACDVR